MPIYEFRCHSCTQVSEHWMKFSDPMPSSCPTCGKGPLTKIISQTAFALKGDGWFRSLYSKTPAKTETPTPNDTKDKNTPSPSAATPAADSSTTK